MIGKQFFNATIGRLRGKRTAPTATAGVPGVAIYGGFVQDGEKKSDLKGRKRYQTYADMLANVNILAAGVRHFLNLVSKAAWKVEPAPDSGARGEEIAELVESILLKKLRTPWHRVIRRSAMYRFYGFSIQEWTALARDDGAIGFLDIEPRAQITIEKWDRDDNGHIIGVIQRSPQDFREIYLEREKIVYLVDDSLHDSPEGLGLFRHVVDVSKDIRRLEQLEGYGYETDLRGIPVARGPFALLQKMVDDEDMTDEERNAAEKPLRDFVENHVKNPALGIYIDSMTYQNTDEASTPSSVRQWDVELLKGSNMPHEAVAKAIERKNRELARVLGIENLLLGEKGGGSLAMARDKSDNFALIVDNSLKELAEAYATDLVETLGQLNGWPEELLPTLKPEKLQHRSIEEITAALADLSNAGAPIDPADLEVVNAVRDMLGLPRVDEALLLLDNDLGEGDKPTPPNESTTDDPDDPDDMPESAEEQQE